MTPEALAATRAFVLILETIGSWPSGVFGLIGLILLLMVLGPYVGLLIYGSGQAKRQREQDKQFGAMVDMYENNVDLVNTGHKREERWEKHADSLAEIIHLNTQMSTRLIEKINNNMYCPAIREKGPTG